MYIMGWLREKTIYRLNKKNLKRVPNTPGVYKIYDEERQPMYVGTTAGNWGKQWGDGKVQRRGQGARNAAQRDRYRYGLKHRISSYQQKDDYQEHKTKRALRDDKPSYFYYDTIRNEEKRKATEKRLKNGHKHNHR